MMMPLRKVRLVFLAALFVAGARITIWDFLQLGRKIPELAAPESRADLIRVEKTARKLTLLRGSDILKTYRISLGRDPDGPKSQEGDGRTPEGRYLIDSRNGRSRFHLALHISYPDANDRARAQQRSLPPGGDIMVHGLPNGLSWLDRLHLNRDWTDGCIAVTDPEMDEIWARVATGTAIDILP
jgi:murein L,D-transpeptidase YafK